MANPSKINNLLAEQSLAAGIFSQSLIEVLYFFMASCGLVSPDQILRALNSKMKELIALQAEAEPAACKMLEFAQRRLEAFMTQISTWQTGPEFHVEIPQTDHFPRATGLEGNRPARPRPGGQASCAPITQRV